MFHIRTRGVQLLFLLGQLGLLSACFWLWLPWAQIGRGGAALSLQHYVVYNAVLLIGIALGYFTERDKSYFRNPTLPSSAQNALWQLVFCVGSLFVFLVGTQDNTISRLFLFTLLPVVFAVLVLTQLYLPSLLIQANFSGPHEQRIALVGPPHKVARLSEWLAGKTDIGCRVLGYVWDEPLDGAAGAVQKLGGLTELDRVFKEWNITQVIMADCTQADAILQACSAACEAHGVRFMVLIDFEAKLRRAVTIIEQDGLRFVGLRQEPLEDPFNRLAKRCVDIAVALPVVLFLLPWLTLLVAVLQRRQSPGPVFFRQRRAGIQQRSFVMFKYRTMHVVNDDEARQAQPDDPRVFAAGAWLRRLSIDELPQFYNVLIGDMSVVGPRPHLSVHNELFAKALANYHVRAVVKPGITGLAQVRGLRGGTQSETSIMNRVEADIQYLETWTFGMDCWIILRTATQVLSPPKTAY